MSRLVSIGMIDKLRQAAAGTRDCRVVAVLISPGTDGPVGEAFTFADEEDLVVVAASLLDKARIRLAAGPAPHPLAERIERALEHLPSTWDEADAPVVSATAGPETVQ